MNSTIDIIRYIRYLFLPVFRIANNVTHKNATIIEVSYRRIS